jgi:ABC-type polysaccharide/polyol phosphate export permease
MMSAMVKRDIYTKYAGSYLGLIWTIVHPISQIIIFSFVFAIVLRIRIGPEFVGVNFTEWLICGLIPWLYFVEVLSRSPNIILDHVSLVTKMKINSEILAINNVLSGLINHGIYMFMFLVYLAITGIHFKITILYVPVYLVGISFFMLGLSWIIGSLNVFLRDVGQVIGVLLNLWFYFTPIIYPVNAIPDAFKVYLELNPVYYIVQGYRIIFLSNEPINHFGLLYLYGTGIVCFTVGGLVFRKLKKGFADVL